MRNIISFTFILLFAFCSSLKAQNEGNDLMKTKIIALLNLKNYKEIYALGDEKFRQDVTENQLLELLKGTAELGKTKKTELLETDSENISYYRLFFKDKSLKLSLRAIGSRYDVFGLSFYKLPIIKSRTIFSSDNPLKSKLDTIVTNAVTSYISNINVAGLSVGIFYKGQSYLYNFGETQKGNHTIPTQNTKYEIGSVTKVFTGILLANAVKEGKINLQDDIRKYLKGSYPNLEFENQPVRIVNLSNHTSGLPLNPENYDQFRFSDQSKVLEVLKRTKPQYLPGSKESYSNFAVEILGIILENVYHKTYSQLVEDYIFKPYEMTNSQIKVSEKDKKMMATGYDLEGNIAPLVSDKYVKAAGGITSTTKDMLLFIQNQLNVQLETPEWLSHQITFGDSKKGRGLGWGISTTKKGNLKWGHAGGTDGYTSLLTIYPELSLGIILMTNNGDHDDNAFYDIEKQIYQNFNP